MENPDFLAIGHVTKDLLAGGGYTIGGTVTYAALAARGLGLSVAVLTSAPDELELSTHLPGVDLHVEPAPDATTFENIYEGQRRRQFLHATAAPLKAAHLPPGWRDSSIVLLGPIAGELGLDWLGVFSCGLVGVTPQGWMRQWDSSGRVSKRPWLEARKVLSCVDVLVFSEEDVDEDSALIERYAEMATIAVVTQGNNGATVFHKGASQRFPAFRAQVVDPTGAGDVFAAAFLVRLRETNDPWASARFANCAASFAIEGPGVSAIADREQVEERLLHGALYD